MSKLSSELSELRVVDLKEMLRNQGLPVSGAKDELISRLVDYKESATLGSGSMNSPMVLDTPTPSTPSRRGRTPRATAKAPTPRRVRTPRKTTKAVKEVETPKKGSPRKISSPQKFDLATPPKAKTPVKTPLVEEKEELTEAEKAVEEVSKQLFFSEEQKTTNDDEGDDVLSVAEAALEEELVIAKEEEKEELKPVCTKRPRGVCCVYLSSVLMLIMCAAVYIAGADELSFQRIFKNLVVDDTDGGLGLVSPPFSSAAILSFFLLPFLCILPFVMRRVSEKCCPCAPVATAEDPKKSSAICCLGMKCCPMKAILGPCPWGATVRVMAFLFVFVPTILVALRLCPCSAETLFPENSIALINNSLFWSFIIYMYIMSLIAFFVNKISAILFLSAALLHTPWFVDIALKEVLPYIVEYVQPHPVLWGRVCFLVAVAYHAVSRVVAMCYSNCNC